MGIFNFFKKNKVANDQKHATHGAVRNDVNTNPFSKTEVEECIKTLVKISNLFKESKLLVGGRNETMMRRMHSYVGIVGFLYEEEYHYGLMSDIVDKTILTHYVLVANAMSDSNHKKKTLSDLADNWSDILQVIYNMQLESNPEGARFKQMEQAISKVTSVFEKLSDKKCREPKDPRKVTPRRVTYNPLNITENPSLAQGHSIPDMTNVFAQDLIPQLASNNASLQIKDIIASYTISLIKSYSDNAGFVPMVIVDQITGQISQVTDMFHEVSYAPYSSLKEYVLSKIYR